MSEFVVIGAGVAGLRCAGILADAGHAVTVLEAEPTVGGRLRTDRVDGYLCDHGFALVNPAYPELQQAVDLTELDVRPFRTGVLVRTERSGLTVVADPRREPRLMAATLRSGYLSPGEVAALLKWVAPAWGGWSAGQDVSVADSWDTAGVHGRLRTEVIEPFLAGVLADSSGSTSTQFVRRLVRFFLEGTPGVPSRGMATVPALMAARTTASIRVGEPAREILPCGSGWSVRTDTQTYQAAAVVVATEASAVAGLVSGLARDTFLNGLRDMRGLATWWFATDQAPHPWPMIVVDGRRSGGRVPGPVWNAAVVSAAAPTYAPAGRHLVAATTLIDGPSDLASDTEVRRHLAHMYGCDTTDWEVVTHHVIPRALPQVRPGHAEAMSVQVKPGLYVCGDHRDDSSIQGALSSGRRTAHAILSPSSSGR
ncbi:Renalase [Austwickia sp. TVS 96-490-7B]|uniref:FAD-dependent oxidoreductase n=1 Tax=Austwickia sp. TVS 96-490-7B TaxID=2830843 RepID=UPI001C5638EB|nr:FAD-dependent oxidoreductase [Austwickia sp. TVS 96-490-7B]MBW3084091.1 Renalase [Austwickia sp. TVS 96-490-7B]